MSRVHAVPSLALAVALGAGATQAAPGEWSVEAQPMYMQVEGNDQHVLTIHRIDADARPQRDDKTAVALDTDNELAYRVEFQYRRPEWSWGFDFFWFATSQKVADLTAAAPGSPGDRVSFEVADRTFTSNNPGQVLFYNVLEDTDIAYWTVDLYALKTLAERPQSALQLQLGLRTGDFDNDYRAVVGIQNVGGLRMDASSNYDRMMGPLVGLSGKIDRGRNSIAGYIGQSVLVGTAEQLSGSSREFTGPFSETPTFTSHETIRRDDVDVAIPITEFRVKWSYRFAEHISVGAGVHTSAWWDVSVPPGVVPGVDGDEAFRENTIVSVGLFGAVKYTL